MSMENVQGDSPLYTPRRVQKCLFGSGGSSKRKKMYRFQRDSKISGNLSGEESDLGPMSPLALSDNSPSSCNSSPNIPLLSPKLTPKRFALSFSRHSAWDENSPVTCRKNSENHTQTSLRKALQAVKHFSQKEILPDSPKSLSNSPPKNLNKRTPDQAEIDMEEAVPDTPERQFGNELQNNIIETPRNFVSSECKLTTPLTTDKKMNSLPRLHRRKSLNILDMIEDSPEKKENSLKRYAVDELGNTAAKILKIDENHSVPRARAALFQDKDNESKLRNITLSTKNFYSNSETKKGFRIISDSIEHKRIRRNNLHYRRSMKRHSIGGINAGVFHSIKKPKSRSSLDSAKNSRSPQMNEKQDNTNVQENVRARKKRKVEEAEMTHRSPTERTPSPEIDLNKRFFKIKKSSKRNLSAMVTINKRMKLKVASDGTMTLNHKNRTQSHKRLKTADISFDATDLLIDEPELEAAIEENKVANILKVLEDDWADDDYDTMEILTNETPEGLSPLKPTMILNDVTMSPASELSNMTSTMNIEDISTSRVAENIPFNDNEKVDNDNTSKGPKYYPIFNKGYSANKIFEEPNKKSNNSKDSMNWQLSVKLSGRENQYQLDAGQKNFGATQCTECGVVYHIGDPEDENAHLNYHNNRKSLKFPGWKSERVIMEDLFTSSRVILVEPNDPKLCWKKVTEILAYVDTDLGLADTKLSDYEQKRVYLYIRDKAIIGVLVAEHITSAHRMIPELLELNCCTAESSPAKCGINVVWTDLNNRRQGIATKLVDILRAHFYFGYVMSMDDIAFSIPTVSGKLFAEKYTKTRNFKVYS